MMLSRSVLIVVVVILIVTTKLLGERAKAFSEGVLIGPQFDTAGCLVDGRHQLDKVLKQPRTALLSRQAHEAVERVGPHARVRVTETQRVDYVRCVELWCVLRLELMNKTAITHH